MFSDRLRTSVRWRPTGRVHARLEAERGRECSDLRRRRCAVSDGAAGSGGRRRSSGSSRCWSGCSTRRRRRARDHDSGRVLAGVDGCLLRGEGSGGNRAADSRTVQVLERDGSGVQTRELRRLRAVCRERQLDGWVVQDKARVDVLVQLLCDG